MTPAPPPRSTAGFSSIEVLISAAIALVVTGALWTFFGAQHRALAAIDLYERSQNVTRAALDLFTRELRMSGYDPGGNPGAIPNSPGPTAPGVERCLVTATSTLLRFQQDLDGNGVIAGAGEDVTWDLSGGALRRTDGAGAPVVLATGLDTNALQFRYFNGSNPPVELVPGGSPAQLSQAQRDTVAKVRVTVRASLDNPDTNGAQHAAAAQTEVAIRSRSLTNF